MVGPHFEALDEGVLLMPLDSRYTQVGFNLISVQVCSRIDCFSSLANIFGEIAVAGFYVCLMKSEVNGLENCRAVNRVCCGGGGTPLNVNNIQFSSIW